MCIDEAGGRQRGGGWRCTRDESGSMPMSKRQSGEMMKGAIVAVSCSEQGVCGGALHECTGRVDTHIPSEQHKYTPRHE